jgi:predicted amidohydrolase
VRVALAQLDCRLGDVEANVRRARRALAAADEDGADLVVFPELYLTGYALAHAGADTSGSATDVAALVENARRASFLLGFHERDGSRRYNSAAYVERGSLLHVHRKLCLPQYLRFQEASLFAPGEEMRAFDTALGRLAVLVCEDAWRPVVPFLAVQDGATMLLVPACSSTALPEAEEYWRELTRFYARMLECYVVFANRVGEEAGMTFWGGSHVVDPLGEVVAEAPRLEETLLLADVDPARVEERRRQLPLLDEPRLDIVRAELDRLLSRG